MNTQINITENGTTTLATAGKYCDRNIDVNVDVESDYDTFWDAYQENGSRTNYYFSFYYWADDNFKPKYNITAKSLEQGFRESRITNLKQLLIDSGVTLSFISNCETYALYQAFLNSQITHIPALESARINNAASCFNGCKNLVSIERIALNDNCNYDSAFKDCTALEEVRLGSKISKTTAFNHSPKLSKASIESVVNALSSTTSGLTVYFSKTAKEAAFTAEEWSALIATKTNWTISLA